MSCMSGGTGTALAASITRRISLRLITLPGWVMATVPVVLMERMC